MALNLPPRPPVNHDRAGRLKMSIEALGALLRLPSGHEVVGVRLVPLAGGYQTIELTIEGADLPVRGEGGYAEEVQLTVWVEHKDGIVTRRASFAHLADDEKKRWVLSTEPYDASR